MRAAGAVERVAKWARRKPTPWPPCTHLHFWRCCSEGWGGGSVAVASRRTGTSHGGRYVRREAETGAESGESGSRALGRRRIWANDADVMHQEWRGEQRPRRARLARKRAVTTFFGWEWRYSPSPLPLRLRARSLGTLERSFGRRSARTADRKVVTGSQDSGRRRYGTRGRGPSSSIWKGHSEAVTSASFSSRRVTSGDGGVWTIKSEALERADGGPRSSTSTGTPVLSFRRRSARTGRAWSPPVMTGRRRYGTRGRRPNSSTLKGHSDSVNSASFSTDLTRGGHRQR